MVLEDLFIIYVYVCVVYELLYTLYVQVPAKLEECVRSPATGVPDSCELSRGYWEPPSFARAIKSS